MRTVSNIHRERQALQFAGLHPDRTVRDQPEREAGSTKGRQGRERIGEQHAGAGKPGAKVAPQRLGQSSRQLELGHRLAEQLPARPISFAIAFDDGSNVLVLRDWIEDGSKPGPLISYEPLEASMPIEQRSVEIEEHRADARQHRNARQNSDAVVTAGADASLRSSRATR